MDTQTVRRAIAASGRKVISSTSDSDGLYVEIVLDDRRVISIFKTTDHVRVWRETVHTPLMRTEEDLIRALTHGEPGRVS